ncbi:hypothetical protein Bca4012_086408 [Brassica carinata]
MQAHLSWQRSDDKDANSETQASSSSSEALSSLTNISYIPSYSTHFNSHICPSSSSSIAPPLGFVITSSNNKRNSQIRRTSRAEIRN